jgi:hypothetical protein
LGSVCSPTKVANTLCRLQDTFYFWSELCSISMQGTEQKTSPTDEKGTGQDAARQEIKQFCERHFGGDVSGAAVALGRTEDEINEMITGAAEVDDDLMMKLRGIDQERSGKNLTQPGSNVGESGTSE